MLANAVKFTPPGGVIDIELVDTGHNHLRISVRDDGAGIDPEFLPYVFDRFRQADGSVSRQHGGPGWASRLCVTWSSCTAASQC